MSNLSREHSAYRAAGQALAAVLHGSPLIRVGIRGVEVGWSDEPHGRRPRAEILADIAIGLGGVAAEEYFSFGCPRPASRSALTFYCFNESQMADLVEVEKLVTLVDPDASADVGYRAFQQAFDLIAEPRLWPAVEWLAAELLCRDIDAREIESIFDAVEFRVTSARSDAGDDGGSFDID